MLDWLVKIDRNLFLIINNHEWPKAVDAFMIAVSSEYPWILGFLGFIGYVIIKKRKDFANLLLWMGVSIGASDAIAHHVLKAYFGRLRPCKQEPIVRILDGCAGFLSFPSNHATNAMCLAVILLCISQNKLTYSLLGLALLVGFSRVYVGAHYPADVLLGFIVGGSIGLISHRMRKGLYSNNSQT